MSQLTQAQTKQQTTKSSLIKSDLLQRAAITPIHSPTLQRCSNGVECPECRQKRLEREGTLQRAAVTSAPTNGVPPIVHDVLNSPGQPLNAGTRAFMEPRFGHDFSGVRVHTDARAAESARAVNALAYTVGSDVVFGTGQYVPGTSEGRRLLAHELTHVVQQGSNIRYKLAINEPSDQYEQEADRTALAIIQSTPFSIARQQGTGLMRQAEAPKAGKQEEDSNLKELKAKVSELVKIKFENNYKKAFDFYDANHDGGVDATEIRHLLEDANIGNRFTRGSWVKGILEKLDTNKNGKIEWKEFENGIKS